MIEQFVEDVLREIDNESVDAKSHFGKLLNKLTEDPDKTSATIQRCLFMIANSVYNDSALATVCQSIGDSFGYATGMSPHTPPAIGVSGVASMGLTFINWCYKADLITLRKVKMEGDTHPTWYASAKGQFATFVEENCEEKEQLPLTEGPILWESPVMVRDGIYAELVKGSKRNQLLSLYTKDKMPLVYESVNRANSQGWVIDEFVYGLMTTAAVDNPFLPTQIFENELDDAKQASIKLKWRANSYREFLLKEVITGDDVDPKKAMSIATKNTNAKFAEGRLAFKKVNSKWDKQSAFNKALGKASGLRGETVNFVYDLDSRGRMYVQNASFLNPMSSDNAKALLSYSQSQPVDLYNLAVSTANAWGEDKSLFDERVDWVNENMEMLRAVGENPWAHLDYLTSVGLHREKKEKWQALRYARVWFLLHEHIEAGGETETFTTNVPVAADGSNQGLQLLSLLAKCEWTASETNLTTMYDENGKQKLGDIYSYIGGFVPDAIKALPEVKRTDALMAFCKDLEESPKLRRLVSKRNVMCKSYNLSRWGAGDAHLEDKADYGVDSAEFLDYSDCFTLGGVIYDILTTKLPRASAMMQFMVDMIDELPDDASPILKWKQSDGFTAYCCKEKSKTVQAQGQVGPHNVTISLTVPSGIIDKRGHKLAIAPNVIHSYDATILRFVIGEMPAEAQVSTVHDSFSTDSFHADKLKEVARVAYKACCTRSHFKTMFEETFDMEIELPAAGNLDLSELDTCEYFIN